jgi:hypothetical protein
MLMEQNVFLLTRAKRTMAIVHTTRNALHWDQDNDSALAMLDSLAMACHALQ